MIENLNEEKKQKELKKKEKDSQRTIVLVESQSFEKSDRLMVSSDRSKLNFILLR